MMPRGLPSGSALFRVDDRARHLRGRFARAQDFRHALSPLRECGNRDQISSTSERTIAQARKSKMPVNAFRSLPFRARRRLGILQRSRKCRSSRSSIITCLRRRGRRRVPHRRAPVHRRDGFEIYFAPEHSEKLWSNLLEAGASQGYCLRLGARNTASWKRRCASMATKSTTPRLRGRLAWLDLQAGKGRISRTRNSIRRKAEGVERTLVGFEMQDR